MMTNEPERAAETPAPATPSEPLDAAAPGETAITATPPVPETPAVDLPPPAWLVKADYLLLALVLVLCFFLGSFTATNSDHWMHLTIGKQISDGTFRFGVDTFSWMTGPVGEQPAVHWVHHSWLYSWLVYQLNESMGGEGLVLLKAILFAFSIGLVSRVGWNEANRWFVVICLSIAAVAMSPRMLLQPIAFSMLFLSITLFLMDRASLFSYPEAGATPDVRWLWGLPTLFALWANVDSWFILGPILLGLCWAVCGLAGRVRGISSVPGKTLGLVFTAGLVACLVNPFHVRVFQLPPELAYIVVRIVEPLGVTLPDAVFAGGKTLRAFHRAEMESALLSTWSLSPFSSMYWNTAIGKNAAGLAFVPLLVLGLVAFTLSAYVPHREDAPTLHLGRFAIWLLLAVLALVLHRMIVFWALLAAPLTAMTLGDFLTWQHKTSPATADSRRRALQSARVLSVPFMLLLLFMAWPGWLHGSTEFSSARRVAWGAHIDPSLLHSAEALNRTPGAFDHPNLFNVSLDLGNITPSASPKFKHAVDSRLALFARDAAAYLAARAALTDRSKPAEAWQDVFTRHDIRHIALTNFGSDSKGIRLRYLANADEWRILHGDSRQMVFSWAGPNERWPVNTGIDDLNREAFGKVPASLKPPAEGAPTPLTPNWPTLFLEGVGGRPTSISEADLFLSRFELARECTGRMVQYEGRRNPEPDKVLLFKAKAIVQGLGMLHGCPGAGTTFSYSLMSALQFSAFVQGEFGPPALPILALRAARRAVAENPRDANAYTALHRTSEFLRQNQEENWLGIKGRLGPRHPSRLRDRVRQLTSVTAIYSAVQLEPDHVQYNHLLSVMFEQDHLYDSALRHLQVVESLLPAHLARLNLNPKDRDANIREFREMVARSENNVMQRRSKFKEYESEKDTLKKAHIALNLRYEELRGKGRAESPLGLGEKSLEIIESIKIDALEPEKRLAFLQTYFDLLLRLGRAHAVSDWLKEPKNKESLPREMYAEYRLVSAVPVGDYAGAQEALDILEEGFTGQLQKEREAAARAYASLFRAPVFAPVLSSVLGSAPLGSENVRGAAIALSDQLDRVNLLKNEMCNAIALRGILALESGDTSAALAHFERAISLAGSDFVFSDRPIVQRYLELLKSQRPVLP